MSQEENLTYDQLLATKPRVLLRLCDALRRENPNYSNYDIKEIVMKSCLQIRQKDTIRRALPDEFKDKQKRETAQMGNEAKYELAQTRV